MPDPNEKVAEIEESQVSEEVAKQFDEGSSESEPTAEEKEPTSKEEAPGTETPLKTDTESEEVKEEVKEEPKEEDDDTRFDKHPRWQKLQQERDEAREQAREFADFKAKLEGFELTELERLKEAGKLLRQHPELAKKVQEVIDKHPFQDERVRAEVNQVNQRVMELEHKLILEKYDNTVEKLMGEKKVDKEMAPIIKEILDNRVVAKKLDMDAIPKELDGILKQMSVLSRKTIAGYVETKGKEPRVPASPKEKGKVIIAKKESADELDVIGELADGLKASKG